MDLQNPRLSLVVLCSLPFAGVLVIPCHSNLDDYIRKGDGLCALSTVAALYSRTVVVGMVFQELCRATDACMPC